MVSPSIISAAVYLGPTIITALSKVLDKGIDSWFSNSENKEEVQNFVSSPEFQQEFSQVLHDILDETAINLNKEVVEKVVSEINLSLTNNLDKSKEEIGKLLALQMAQLQANMIAATNEKIIASNEKILATNEKILAVHEKIAATNEKVATISQTLHFWGAGVLASILVLIALQILL